jgi:hypothetical protein
MCIEKYGMMPSIYTQAFSGNGYWLLYGISFCTKVCCQNYVKMLYAYCTQVCCLHLLKFGIFCTNVFVWIYWYLYVYCAKFYYLKRPMFESQISFINRKNEFIWLLKLSTSFVIFSVFIKYQIVYGFGLDQKIEDPTLGWISLLARIERIQYNQGRGICCVDTKCNEGYHEWTFGNYIHNFLWVMMIEKCCYVFQDLKPWPKSLRIDWWSFNYKAKMLEHVFLWIYL